MFSQIFSKIPTWLSGVFAFAALAFKDQENFFPLSAHSDLRFQLVGECLEVLALIGIFALARLRFPEKTEIPASTAPAKAPPIFTGVIIAAFLLVTFWRDCFPNDVFKFGEALKDVGYSIIPGVAIALFALIARARSAKPSEQEKSGI